GPGQRAGRYRRGGDAVRRVPGRPGRLPLRAGRLGQRVHRGGGACAAAHGLRHGHRPARAAGRGAAAAGADRARRAGPDHQGRPAAGPAPAAGRAARHPRAGVGTRRGRFLKFSAVFITTIAIPPEETPMPITRQRFLHAALAAAALAAAGGAAAQAYPAKPVTFVVPTAAGGTTDLSARMVAQALSPVLGQSVVVDNKGGGNGAIAAAIVKRAEADGYTLLMQYSGYHVISP